jgi:hypothetical protein
LRRAAAAAAAAARVPEEEDSMPLAFAEVVPGPVRFAGVPIAAA